MTISEKKPKELAWSHRASPAASVAISELKKVKAQQAILSKKSALLQRIIVKEGGGAAHGVRAAVRHQDGYTGMRKVSRKPRDYVLLLEAA